MRSELASRAVRFSVEATIFKSQFGLATRAQLLDEGVTRGQINVAVAQGRWLRAASGLYALANWPALPARRLLAACLITEGVASHASAAWLWGLLRDQPDQLSVVVQHGQTPATPSKGRRAKGSNGLLDPSTLVVHHSRDLSPNSISNWRGVPTTNPLRTLVDLAAVSGVEVFDEAVDTALAKRLTTVEALWAEAERLRHRGRRGPAQIMARLETRRFTGAPTPSILESRTLRLLAGANIKVDKCEVVDREGRYRLDIQLGPGLFVEVDGFAYHWGPEHKHHDDRRRNELRLQGFEILVYDWTVVTSEPRRVLHEVRTALTRLTSKSELRGRTEDPGQSQGQAKAKAKAKAKPKPEPVAIR